jgi:hypothetical protein
MSTDEADPLSLSSLLSSRSSVDRRSLLPDADSRSGSVIVVSVLDANEFVAGTVAKLLSALTKVVSSGMVVSIISQAVSVGVGLRLRSPSPFTGESARHDRLKGCNGRLMADLPSATNKLSPSVSDWSKGGVGRSVRGRIAIIGSAGPSVRTMLGPNENCLTPSAPCVSGDSRLATGCALRVRLLCRRGRRDCAAAAVCSKVRRSVSVHGSLSWSPVLCTKVRASRRRLAACACNCARLFLRSRSLRSRLE